MTVKENISLLNEMKEAVTGHCMAAKVEDDGSVLRITYPAGEWSYGIQGIQVVYDGNMSKYQAYSKALVRMEHDWMNSFPGANL